MAVFSLFYDVTLQIGSNGKMKAYLRLDKMRGFAISCVISINVLWYCVTLWASYALGGLSRKREGGSGEERDKMEEGDLEAASMGLVRRSLQC